MLGENNFIPLRLKKTYDTINILIKKINDSASGEVKYKDILGTKEAIEHELSIHPEIDIDNTINMSQSSEYEFIDLTYSRKHKETDNNERIAYSLKNFFTQIVNDIISERLRTVCLSFDINGVKSLLKELNSSDYKIRNYTFYDDLALGNDIRCMDEYVSLTQKIESITRYNNQYINNYIFLSTDKIAFYYEIVDIKKFSLSKQMINDQLNLYKVSEGKFKIDDGDYTTQEAIEYLEKDRFGVSITVKIETNIQKNSGFKVCFEY